MPQAFVHVTCTNEDGNLFLRCTCRIYDIIQRAAKQETPLSPGEEFVPDSSLTCMHCRFYKDHLNNAYERISSEPQDNLLRALHMVHESLQYMNDPVQLVGSVIDQGTTRFSCQGKESYSLIHMSFYNKICQVKCMDGICAANFKNHKNITRRDPDHEATKMCSHLRTLFSHFGYVKGFSLITSPIQSMRLKKKSNLLLVHLTVMLLTMMMQMFPDLLLVILTLPVVLSLIHI